VTGEIKFVKKQRDVGLLYGRPIMPNTNNLSLYKHEFSGYHYGSSDKPGSKSLQL